MEEDCSNIGCYELANPIVKCTNCKILYCSAKCKKAHAKKHKKECKFVPAEPKLTHENVMNQINNIPPEFLDTVKAREEDKEYMYISENGDIKSLNDLQNIKKIKIPIHLRDIIYPNYESDDLEYYEMTQHGNEPTVCHPIMNRNRAANLFGTLYEKNKERIKELAKVPDDVRGGFLDLVCNDYVELASLFHDNDISKIVWTEDDISNRNFTTSMDKDGRKDNLLYGRLSIRDFEDKLMFHKVICFRLQRDIVEKFASLKALKNDDIPPEIFKVTDGKSSQNDEDLVIPALNYNIMLPKVASDY